MNKTSRKKSEKEPNLIGLPSMRPIDLERADQLMVEGLIIRKQRLEEAQKLFDDDVKVAFAQLERVYSLAPGSIGTVYALMGFQLIPQPQAKEAASE
jgi:hypothetical protein